ncbi:hypothetical protein [Rhizobium sp. LjRoot254]|uniref:hypothetical protein n=1 Tax=Rhizobium sp. LjRoot254 TaxID=3342297 RepID=UPI003ED09A66
MTYDDAIAAGLFPHGADALETKVAEMMEIAGDSKTLEPHTASQVGENHAPDLISLDLTQEEHDHILERRARTRFASLAR